MDNHSLQFSNKSFTVDKVFRLWKPVAFTDAWRKCDTSVLDDIAPSWLSRRKELQEDSKEYKEFLERLKREHAVETGVIEQIYDLKKGITETLIKEGFVKSYLSHGDTNVSKDDLMNHLGDHLDAVDFVFDMIKQNRPLSVGFIKELHQLTTRHQKSAEGRDQFGNRLKIPLLKGEFKERENNPTATDGTKILYCPPVHVDAEMDNLVKIYADLVEAKINPLIIAAWFHHAFVTIHPFQDGNGRVARLLASLIFIKFGFFPFTVLREDAKVKYINSLEQADNGLVQPLVSYFGEVQRKNIEVALNIKEVEETSLDKVVSILNKKLSEQSLNKESYFKISSFIYDVYGICEEEIIKISKVLTKKNHKQVKINHFRTTSVVKGRPIFPFYEQVLSYSKLNNYHFDNTMPKMFTGISITLINSKLAYRIILPIHGYGFSKNVIGIGTLLESQDLNIEDQNWNPIPPNIPPHIISIEGELENKSKNIKKYIEESFTLALAQIVNEI